MSLPRLRTGHVLAGIVLLTFLVHAGNLRNGFTNWDDPGYILKNPLIRDFGLKPAARLFTTFYYNDYYPLNQLSYMVDHALWGLNPRGFHLTNIILHALAAGLAFLIARRLLGGTAVPCVAALTMALHPVNVESVAWLSERKNVLSMFFFLLSFLLYLERERSPQRRRLLYVGSLTAFLAAALSKTIVVPLPVLLLVYDFLFPGLSIRRCVEKLPYFAVSVLVAILTVMSQGEAGAIPPYIGGSIFNNLWTMFDVYLRYLRLLVWPVGLSARYPADFALSFWQPRVIIGAVVVALLVFAAWYWRRRQPLVSFSIAWFFLMLAPVSHIPFPTSVLYADRYLYFPSLAFGWLLAYGLSHLKRPVWLSPALATVVLGLWTAGTVVRTAHWRDSITLWTKAVEIHPHNFFAEAILGDGYVRAGDLKAGLQHKQRGLKLAAKYGWRHIHTELVNTGIVYLKLGHDDEAEKLFDMTLEMRQAANYGPAYKGLGMLAEKREQYGSALYYYLAAVANNDETSRVRNGIQRCLERTGREAQRESFLRDPAAFLQAEATSHRRVARGYINDGDLRRALSRLRMARRLAPADAGIQRDMAIVKRRLRQAAAAPPES